MASEVAPLSAKSISKMNLKPFEIYQFSHLKSTNILEAISRTFFLQINEHYYFAQVWMLLLDKWFIIFDFHWFLVVALVIFWCWQHKDKNKMKELHVDLTKFLLFFSRRKIDFGDHATFPSLLEVNNESLGALRRDLWGQNGGQI